MPFYLKRSLVKTALRNGAVVSRSGLGLTYQRLTRFCQFEIPYAAALAGHDDPTLSRRQRQNFLTNARELIRVVMAVSPAGGRDGRGKRGKGGGGIIFSSGPGGMAGMRGPADLVNL